MLANLATALFEHGRITTTEAKAKRMRPLAERLITFAKRGDLHARRQVLTVVRDKGVVHTLFAEIGPRYVDRPGGYTRIVKIGPRKGDNAPMAVIELVAAVTEKQAVVTEAEKSRGTRFARRRGKAAAETTATTTGTDVDTDTDTDTDADTDTAADTEAEVDATPEAGASDDAEVVAEASDEADASDEPTDEKSDKT